MKKSEVLRCIVFPLILFILSVNGCAKSIAEKPNQTEIRREFTVYIKEKIPDLNIISNNESSLTVKCSGGEETTLQLQKLYKQVSELETQDIQDRRKVYGEFFQIIQELSKPLPSQIDKISPLFYPRLITADYLEILNRNCSSDDLLINQPLKGTGLHIVYVIDSERFIRYVKASQIRKLSLTQTRIHDISLSNLRKHFDRKVVPDTLEKKSLSMIKTMDGYDAARLILVPEYLNEEETIAALIPDCDTLILTMPPDDNDWSQLRELSKAADGEVLLDRPILVSRKGFVLK